jgi:hypothetical protein
MIPEQYIWLAWSLLLLTVWLVLYIGCRGLRPLMRWSSLFAVLFGFSEPLFAGSYWRPSSLFNLANTIHYDLESFLFCFAIGGTAPVLYHLLTRRPFTWPGREHPRRARPFYRELALVLPAFVFPFLLLTGLPLLAGILSMLVGVVARLVCWPGLRRKTIWGGMIFLIYYGLFLWLLRAAAPGYIHQTWGQAGLESIHLDGLPLSELLFAWAFGMYWCGLYEQFTATTRPTPFVA